MLRKIVFLCGARDYHAMDWYRSAIHLFPSREICILTDLIAGEGFKRLINENDKIYRLLIIDKLLFKNQSRIGNIWRNLIKLLVFPFQIFLLKLFSKKHPEALYHAHSMYYLFLAWAAGIPYIGTPQGSDILVKPFKSKLYKYFAIKSLKRAKTITVDSIKMKETIFAISKVDSYIIQNGIDIDSIQSILSQLSNNESVYRTAYASIRAITPLYCIKDIVIARNNYAENDGPPLNFIYPFYENEYKKEVFSILRPNDMDYGLLDKKKLYESFIRTKLVFSIPNSDSSPRTVYEAIFCGCAIAITYNSYYEALPECMKSRVIIVDLNDYNWFAKAIEKSNVIIEKPFYPSEEALNLFDQKRSLQILANLFYN